MNDEADAGSDDSMPLWAELDASKRSAATDPGVYLDKYGRLMATAAGSARAGVGVGSAKSTYTTPNPVRATPDSPTVTSPSASAPTPITTRTPALPPTSAATATSASSHTSKRADRLTTLDSGSLAALRARTPATDASNWLLGVAAVNSFVVARSFFSYFTVIQASHEISLAYNSIDPTHDRDADPFAVQLVGGGVLSLAVIGLFWALWKKSAVKPTPSLLHGGRVLLALSSAAIVVLSFGSIGIAQRVTSAFAFAVNVGGLVAVHRTLNRPE